MPEGGGYHLHAVGPDEGSRPRRPGPAVLSVLLYALLFGSALWYLRAKSPIFQRTQARRPDQPSAAGLAAGAGAARRASPKISRTALLSGDGVAPGARSQYFQRLAVEHCNCGCERTLSDCLANEPTCSRSPALAESLRSRAH